MRPKFCGQLLNAKVIGKFNKNHQKFHEIEVICHEILLTYINFHNLLNLVKVQKFYAKYCSNDMEVLLNTGWILSTFVCSVKNVQKLVKIFVQNFNKSSQYLVNVFLVHHSQFQWNLILFWMTEIFLFNQNLELPNFACWVHCKSKLISFIKKTPSFSNLR